MDGGFTASFLLKNDATSLEDDWLPRTSCVVGHQVKNQNSTLSLTTPNPKVPLFILNPIFIPQTPFIFLNMFTEGFRIGWESPVGFAQNSQERTVYASGCVGFQAGLLSHFNPVII